MLHSLLRIGVVEGNCSTNYTKELNGSYIKLMISISDVYDDRTSVLSGPSCELNYIIRNIYILFRLCNVSAQIQWATEQKIRD